MVKALLDTNILIDYLNAEILARKTLNHYKEKFISIITWIEVMVGAHPSVEKGTQDFLRSFQLIRLDERIAEHAVILRRHYRIKLPDAIILASARTRSMLLVTRNTKDFPASMPDVHIPYQL